MRINGKTPREILKISSFREFLDWVPYSFIQILAVSAFILTILAPLLISLKAVTYVKPEFYISGEIGKYYIAEFYTYDFDTFMHKTVFRFVGAAAVLAYLLALFKNRADGTLARIKQRRDPALVLFGALTVWVLVNVFLVNGPTYYAMEGALPNHENIYVYLTYYLCLFPMGLFLTNGEWKKRLLYFFTSVSLALIPLAIYLHTKVYYKDVIRSVFSNSNYYGIFMNVAISLCASMMVSETSVRRRVFFVAALVANTAVLYYNNTLAKFSRCQIGRAHV